MLFWKFWIVLLLAAVTFRMAFPFLITPFVCVLDLTRRSNLLWTDEDTLTRETLTVASYPVLVLCNLWSAYLVCGWAAFAAGLTAFYSQSPGVTHHWLYYGMGFAVCEAPLTAMSMGKKALLTPLLYLIGILAYIVFCIWPFLMQWPYAWVLPRAAAGPSVAVSPAEEAIKRGKVAENDNDWDLAITEYSNAIRLDPKCAEAYNGRGDAYLGKRDWDNTIADCTEAIRLKPDFAEAYYGRGLAYEKKRDWDNTIADCTEAIRLNPNLALAYYGRGLAYLGKRDWDNLDNTIADCTEAIRLKPDFAEAYYGRGLAYAGKGNLDKVIADCTEAIRLNPKLALAYYGRGFAYEQKGEKSKAEADFAEAKRLGFKPP
jgi:tetratricopeptide (TPR) repeat protein